MKFPLSARLPWLPVMGLILLCGLAWICYSPGLSGGFLFDDFVNLDALGNHGPITNWPRFWIYITSGTADPLGRPLALLSFLLDARDWPADPASFLRTNVLIHLLNGVLLFGLLRRLGRGLGAEPERNDLTALLAAGLWLLHPLFVSTTLYVVQRESMLPATFTLLGLSAYVDGRYRYLDSDGRDGTLQMLIGIVLGTGLAMLAKANGILLPLLAWVLVATVFHSAGSRSITANARMRLQWLDRGLLVLPALVVFAYLVRFLPHLGDPLATRPWTGGQRLLTEPRVLLDYLGLLLVPRSVSTGLFNDNYAVSTGWLRPATTLPSVLIIAGLVVLGFRWRRRAPRLAAALLFFFAGHALESTVVPLEIYFEHRNYLPAMLLFWPLAHVIVEWGARRNLRVAVAIALLGLFAATTWQRTVLWGQPDLLSELWARRNPESPRAQAVAATQLMQSGQYDLAAIYLQSQWQKKPGELQLAFNYVNARCAGQKLTKADISAVTTALGKSTSEDLLIHRWLSNALAEAKHGDCRGMTLTVVEQWIRAAMANPVFAAGGRDVEDFEPLLGELAAYNADPDQALVHFRRALLVNVNPDFAARMAAFLADQGYFKQALELLDVYEANQQRKSKPGFGMAWLHASVLQRQNYWPHELAALRTELNAEIAEQAKRGTKQ